MQGGRFARGFLACCFCFALVAAVALSVAFESIRVRGDGFYSKG